jgi:hypothetical protein
MRLARTAFTQTAAENTFEIVRKIKRARAGTRVGKLKVGRSVSRSIVAFMKNKFVHSQPSPSHDGHHQKDGNQ